MAIESDARSASIFSQVARESNLSDRVAGQITEAVLSGRLVPGARLPSERELAEEFGVSRTVVREAIRSLAAHGLVESRSGRGVEVAVLGPETVRRAMSLFLRGNAEIDYPKVNEVRHALEVRITELAAERATDEDLEGLRECVETMRNAATAGDREELARSDVAFHRALAAATHNELFVVMLGAIEDVMMEVRRLSFSAPGVADYAISAHSEILKCLERHSPRAARDAMRAHLETSDEMWEGPSAAAAKKSSRTASRGRARSPR